MNRLKSCVLQSPRFQMYPNVALACIGNNVPSSTAYLYVDASDHGSGGITEMQP